MGVGWRTGGLCLNREAISTAGGCSPRRTADSREQISSTSSPWSRALVLQRRMDTCLILTLQCKSDETREDLLNPLCSDVIRAGIPAYSHWDLKAESWFISLQNQRSLSFSFSHTNTHLLRVTWVKSLLEPLHFNHCSPVPGHHQSPPSMTPASCPIKGWSHELQAAILQLTP